MIFIVKEEHENRETTSKEKNGRYFDRKSGKKIDKQYNRTIKTMTDESKSNNLEIDDITFHFVSRIEEKNIVVSDEIKEHVHQFLTKLCSEYGVKPKSISLVGDVSTLSYIIGLVVQNYHHFESWDDEELTS